MERLDRDRREDLRARSTRQVIDDHLRLRLRGDLECDLERNYSRDVVMLAAADGVRRGHAGVRALADVLRGYVDQGAYSYRRLVADGEVAMLTWSGGPPDDPTVHGVDSYVVRDGLIVAQTIYFVST